MFLIKYGKMTGVKLGAGMSQKGGIKFSAQLRVDSPLITIYFNQRLIDTHFLPMMVQLILFYF